MICNLLNPESLEKKIAIFAAFENLLQPSRNLTIANRGYYMVSVVGSSLFLTFLATTCRATTPHPLELNQELFQPSKEQIRTGMARNF